MSKKYITIMTSEFHIDERQSYFGISQKKLLDKCSENRNWLNDAGDLDGISLVSENTGYVKKFVKNKYNSTFKVHTFVSADQNLKWHLFVFDGDGVNKF